MVDEKSLGQVVKNLRLSKGLSQTELANKSGISVAEVCRIEKGERKNPSMRLCVCLFKALEVPSEDFLQVVGYKY